MKKLIIIALIIVGCSDPSEDIKLDPIKDYSLNNGSWAGQDIRLWLNVQEKIVTSLIFSDPEDITTYNYKFIGDSLSLEITNKSGGHKNKYYSMISWDLGKDNQTGYFWHEAFSDKKEEIRIYKLK